MIRRLNGHAPVIGPGAFVHDAAEVIGRVRLGERASVWPRAVIRGDTEDIEVGDETNVQDGAVLHADPGMPCRVGSRVTVGHLACVHGCTVEDEVLIGIGAVVLNRARVGQGSLIAARALVTEGMVVPPGSLVVGVPGVIKPLRPELRERIRRTAANYVRLKELYRARG